MRIEKIGQASLYLADCVNLRANVSFDAFVTDPPNGRSFITEDHFKAGPEVIRHFWLDRGKDTAHVGIVFPGTLQVGLYLKPDNMGFIFIEGLPSQPVLFYGLEADNLESIAPEQPEIRHPGAKPIEWFTWAVEKTRGTVIDPFMGSGTCGMACAYLGRPFIGIEVVEQYFDLACERIEKAYNSLKLSA